MKILQLVAGELSEGAARGAYWLHLALCEIGIDSILLTNGRDKADDDFVIGLGNSSLQRLKFAALERIGNLPVHLYRHRKPWIFNTGFAGVDFTKLPVYKEADIIHMHWINGLVAMRTLSNVRKPIVWTMRDMWPMTGGCHIGAAFECSRYETGCGQCPQLGSKIQFDLSRLVVKNKRASLPPQLQLVGISEWLSQCASQSWVFDGFPIQTISNNIDTRLFCPVDTATARQILGLPLNKKIILVGAHDWNDFWKGFDLFIAALSGVSKEDLLVVTFGQNPGQVVSELGIEHTDFGFLSDIISLRLAYSAADVFVAPSKMDAFGKTLAESMACGTPVVCFDATGPKDIVEHLQTGYKAEPFDTVDLAAGINWVLTLSLEHHTRLKHESRKRAVKLFDSRVIAGHYKRLYKQMLTR